MSDPESPLCSYYPENFEVDLNDKKRDYEAVVLLPFIDIAQLILQESLHCLSLSSSSSSNHVDLLTEEEKNRNRTGHSFKYYLKSSKELSEEQYEGEISPHEKCFEPAQRSGTMTSLPGYPSLSQLVLTTRNNLSTDTSSSKAHRTQQKNKKSAKVARENVYQLATLLHKGPINRLKWSHNNPSIDPLHPDRVTIRFLLNDDTNIFLFELAEQIRLQAPIHRYKHYDHHYEGMFKVPPGGHFIEYSFLLHLPKDENVNIQTVGLLAPFSTSTPPDEETAQPETIQSNTISETNETSSNMKAILIDNVLNKLCEIFGAVWCQFLPSCDVDEKSGSVSVKFCDVSHLQQMEQFLEDRFKKLALAELGEVGGVVVNWTAMRQLVVGVFDDNVHNSGDGKSNNGSKEEGFAEWLAKEWMHLVKFLPVFGSRVVEVWVDGSVKQYVLRDREWH